MEILHGISAEFDPGEIAAIIGPNGAGKSTFLKSVFNLCDIYSGKIIFKGKDITKLPAHQLIYEGVSFVMQGRQVFSSMTVKENLEMGAYIFKDKELVKRNLDYIFGQFPFLKDKQDDCAENLSGGQQQMLAIGRALMQDPELLLLDEPSLGLSPKAIKEVFAEIKKIAKDGVSVIIVEQNVQQALDIADKVFVLENGAIAVKGDKNSLNKEKLKKIYFAEN